MPPALQARKVWKQYPGGTTALRDVTLGIEAGETMALIGESGSGKTTLLRLFNRMVDPSRGEVLAEGRSLAEEDEIALRRRTGYVQQQGGLMPHWTVQRNVELVLRLLEWEEEKRKARGREALAMMGLDPEVYGHRYPAELSGGQRQRVALARALAADPPVLLLDEPFGALDPLTRAGVQELFLELEGELRQTIVLVTHDLREALRLGDRVGVLKDGELLQVGTPDELTSSPRPGYVAELLAQVGEAP